MLGLCEIAELHRPSNHLERRSLETYLQHLSKTRLLLGSLYLPSRYCSNTLASNPFPRLNSCAEHRSDDASRLMVPAFAEPDIHLLPQAPKSYRRRLSLCSWYSLPVPKQSEGSLRSVTSFAQSANGGIWQSAHGSSCFIRRQFYAVPARRSPAGTKSRCCRFTASRYATIFRATASVARWRFPFCISL